MMTSLSSSTSLLARQAAIKSHRWLSPKHPLATSLRSHQRSSVTTATATVHGGSSSSTQQAYKNTNMAAAALLLAAASTVAVSSWMVDAPTAAMETLPSSPDIIAAVVKEKSTGITFPQLCNGLSLVGCGVRIKWGFVKVYAVGTYMDPIAMSAIKLRPKEEIEAALLDPIYPRTIRIVMARNLSIDKYTKAIVEALEPRMKGRDMESLEEFKKLNPPVDLVEGAVIEMTIRGDSMLYKNATGGFGAIHSKVFTAAMCDVYYGKDAASPTHKEEVLKGIPNIK